MQRWIGLPLLMMACQSEARTVVSTDTIDEEAKEVQEKAVAILDKLCENNQEDSACQPTSEQESVDDSKNLE